MSKSESKPAEHPSFRDLRGSAKINMTDEELIYFTMGPWDMEQEHGSGDQLLCPGADAESAK